MLISQIQTESSRRGATSTAASNSTTDHCCQHSQHVHCISPETGSHLHHSNLEEDPQRPLVAIQMDGGAGCRPQCWCCCSGASQSSAETQNHLHNSCPAPLLPHMGWAVAAAELCLASLQATCHQHGRHILLRSSLCCRCAGLVRCTP